MHGDNKKTRLLESGHYVGMQFQDGWWFFQVLGNEFLELKPYTLLNENGNRDEIAAQTAGSEDDEITDPQDRHYLIPRDSEQNLVFQVQFGVAPSRMQIYPFFGRNRSPNLRGTTEPGEPQVPYTGFDTPYNDPSTQAEMFTVNSQSLPAFQAFNPADQRQEATMSFHVNKLKYATITDVNFMAAMLQGQRRFRSHMTGFGAQEGDRLKAPNWLMDTFGDSIKTTNEILNEGDSAQAPSVPDTQNLEGIRGSL